MRYVYLRFYPARAEPDSMRTYLRSPEGTEAGQIEVVFRARRCGCGAKTERTPVAGEVDASPKGIEMPIYGPDVNLVKSNQSLWILGLERCFFSATKTRGRVDWMAVDERLAATR